MRLHWIFRTLNCVFSPVLGIMFGLLIVVTSVFGNYILTLMIPIFLTGRYRLWRWMADRAISFWIILPVAVLENIFGVQFNVSGDSIECDKPAIVLMNHRTRLDWMYFWAALFKINPWLVVSSKIALKAELKIIPGAGFGMQANQYIFLKRNIEWDCKRITEAIDYYATIGNNYQILLFPEGTDKVEHTTMRSNQYAKKNGLKELNYVLHPRTAGFVHLVQKMRDYDYIDCIYDVTVAYPKSVVQTEVELVLRGRAPEVVQFHIEKIEIASVPHGDKELANWINNLWEEKEKKLERYYTCPSAVERFPGADDKFIWRDSEHPLRRIIKILTILFWLTVTSIWLYHLTYLIFVQALFAYFIAVCICIHCIYGGIDEMVYWKWKHRRRRN